MTIMNSKYISISIENFQQNNRLCTISLVHNLTGISLFKIEHDNVITTVINKLKDQESNYYFECEGNNANSFRFITNLTESQICNSIFTKVLKANQELILKRKNFPELKLNDKSIQTHKNLFTFSSLSTGTSNSADLSDELIISHKNIIPTVPCNTPITVKDIHENLMNLKSPKKFNIVKNLKTFFNERQPIKREQKQNTTLNGNESTDDSETDSNSDDHDSETDSNSDDRDSDNYTTIRRRTRRRKFCVKKKKRDICIIESNSSDSEKEDIQTWTECVIDVLNTTPQTVDQIYEALKIKHPQRLTGLTPKKILNERCQYLIKQELAQRSIENAGNYKYFV